MPRSQIPLELPAPEGPTTDPEPYNPLHRVHLAESIARALLERPLVPLGAVPVFNGAGVYTIYYTGDFETYAPLGVRNREEAGSAPIYVGKAVPEGGRKGRFLEEPSTTALSGRLLDHAGSVDAAENLDIDDFQCRFLVVESIFIPLGEALLIQRYQPLWNVAVDGFGNHDPGAGRRDQMRCPWDVLHPGRDWAELQKDPAFTYDDVAARAAAHLNAQPLPRLARPYRPRRPRGGR